MRRMRSAFLLLSACLSLSCGGTSEEDLRVALEEAAACTLGDTCIVAGKTSCSCAMPVNERSVEHIRALAADVHCSEGVVKCMSWSQLRCENGRCVGDRN
jgi:hypothetical protein